MASTVVLVLADSAANWSAIGAIGQCVAAIGALAVAVVALRWDHRQRRDRERAQAALVTIEMGGSSAHYGNNNDVWAVRITNHSNQPVDRPQIESMGEVPVHWGWGPVCLADEEGGEYVLQTDEMLLPSRSTDVPYQYLDADGRPVGQGDDRFFDDNSKWVRVDDVTITFRMSGARWRRTGNREPVRSSSRGGARTQHDTGRWRWASRRRDDFHGGHGGAGALRPDGAAGAESGGLR